jgi:hypothetical protein
MNSSTDHSTRSTATGASSNAYQEQARQILVKLVTSLLRDKPRDPVPYIYTYLLAVSKK